MLFKLSLKNIVKSIKDYAIYFFTLVLGVAIFYVFNAIESQTVMMKVSDNTAEIIRLMTNVLSGVSVFVSFVLGFLIIYASRFLIKRRNREFGIYLTLGMGKRKISFILFIETLAIGMISLATGLIVGAGLSQLMSIFVANISVGFKRRTRALPRVLLPQPLSPTTPKVSPFMMWKLTSSTAFTVPDFLSFPLKYTFTWSALTSTSLLFLSSFILSFMSLFGFCAIH